MTSSKVVFVTGGNTGIGYEAVKALQQSEKPYQILLGSRSPEKAKAAIKALQKESPESKNTIEAVQLDLTSDESIEKALEHVKTKFGKLDVLVNNAGASFDYAHASGKVTLRESLTKSYDVNVAGTNVLTWTFMPLLLQSSDPRLLFVGGLSQITKAANEGYFPATPPQPAGWPKKVVFETIGYRCSKTAMNMLMLDWNYKLKADGVKVWAVSPGMCLTDLGGLPEEVKANFGAMGAQHPRQGGEIIRRVVEGERDADVGKFVADNGKFIEW